MNWTKLPAVATTLAAVLIAAPAPAYADPVPSTDEVVAIMAKLTDPGIPAANKTDIVAPGFAPDEAQTIDDHLNRLNTGGYIPLNFVITDIQPAPITSQGHHGRPSWGSRHTAWADCAGRPGWALAESLMTPQWPR
jgi:hypothetical protein